MTTKPDAVVSTMTCFSCDHEFIQQPGQTKCPSCGINIIRMPWRSLGFGNVNLTEMYEDYVPK